MPRFNSPCDSCSVRRVKCDRGRPSCQTCLSRLQRCTYFRTRKRPGPKGPRSKTHLKILEIQQEYGEDDYIQDSKDTAAEEVHEGLKDVCKPERRISHASYSAVLEVFQRRLYDVWPIVSTAELQHQLGQNNDDSATLALAAAVCAATLAQTGIWNLQASSTSRPVTAEDFAKECLRIKHNYQQETSLEALITCVFLHMYYANRDQVTLATVSLREAITYSDLLRLCSAPPSDPGKSKRWQLELRCYWILFVTERTFCIQHDLPIILQRTAHLPEIEQNAEQGDLYSGFCYLVQLFLHVQRPLLPLAEKTMDSTQHIYSKDRILDIQQHIKAKLPSLSLASEVQYVDILTTSAWIRSLLWQYSASRFMLSSSTSVQPLSLDYPLSIAKDLLASLSNVSIDSVRSHGYGMEIKLLQVANSVLDIVLCIPDLLRAQACHLGPLDAIAAIEQLLSAVGGVNSERLTFLHERFSQVPYVMSIPQMLEMPVQDDGSDDSSVSY